MLFKDIEQQTQRHPLTMQLHCQLKVLYSKCLKLSKTLFYSTEHVNKHAFYGTNNKPPKDTKTQSRAKRLFSLCCRTQIYPPAERLQSSYTVEAEKDEMRMESKVTDVPINRLGDSSSRQSIKMKAVQVKLE